jgi:hypothetical protein
VEERGKGQGRASEDEELVIWSAPIGVQARSLTGASAAGFQPRYQRRVVVLYAALAAALSGALAFAGPLQDHFTYRSPAPLLPPPILLPFLTPPAALRSLVHTAPLIAVAPVLAYLRDPDAH